MTYQTIATGGGVGHMLAGGRQWHLSDRSLQVSNHSH